MCFRIVAPSFVITTSPWAVWICTPRDQRGGRGSAGGEDGAQGKKGKGRTILSIPLGPSDVRTASLTAFAAFMLDSRTSMGLP